MLTQNTRVKLMDHRLNGENPVGQRVKAVGQSLEGSGAAWPFTGSRELEYHRAT